MKDYESLHFGTCNTNLTGFSPARCFELGSKVKARYHEFLPTTVFAIMAVLSGILVLTLPETNNQKLPDSLREAQELDTRPQEEVARTKL
ncbi:Solute carrier family 22 member 6-A [Eumeta japonica]|uniref:Solute carrier family 22 member 6-A n=1 Tax=Eumeta variegata TaxID=151549 RepID=A0A4C1WRT1_EUMVA|nr:Solute carrier family 22 member 6-A [Eumeta japonica]